MNNNITEDFVSFEVAKLLKEKGFNVLVPQGYDTNELEYEKYDLPKGIQFGISSNTGKENFVTAPTHALAIKWIRENFGIHIEIRHIKTFGVNRFHIVIWKYSEEDYHTIHCNNNIGYEVWNTPEEATEAALLYTLQNLIK